MALICSMPYFGISQETDQQEQIWVKNWEEAKTVAQKENKRILMYFTGSDWCMPCIMLKEDFFSTSKFKSFANSYVFLKIDIPRSQDIITPEQRKHNLKILDTYNEEKSFPLINIMTFKGKILDHHSGYSSLRDPSYHFALLEKYAKK